MKKNLLAIGLLAIGYSVQAQILLHVDNTAKMYVSKGTLVYNGGGLQTKGDGSIENRGNVMVNGVSGDLFRNLDASGNTVVNGTGGRFVNKLNEEGSYAQVNVNNSTTPPVYTYGQLFITGLNQTDISGVVNQEYRQLSHGSYQQMGLPFFGKTASTLSSELGKTFNNTRRSTNEILFWNNAGAVADNLPNGLNTVLGTAVSPFAYFMVGGANLNVSNATRTLVGRPVADTGMLFNLTGAGNGINFGFGGNQPNAYNEFYNTYLRDGFHIAENGASSAWQGNFGRNIYQFGNPFFTNLDLSQIAFADSGANGDGNNISNIYGVRLEPQGMQFNQNVGSVVTAKSKQITFGAGVPTGDLDYMMVRPFGTFVVKLTDNSVQTLNLATLRRFNYYTRNSGTSYNVAASKNGQSTTVKQLGVVGLDSNGNEIDRTYYVVYGGGVSGQPGQVTCEVTTSGNQMGTYEEDAVNGGYDFNNSSYYLYVNEANEVNFKGKNIKLVNYNPAVVSFKFEIRENAALVANGTHVLSAGEGFYYKKSTSTNVSPAVHGTSVPATGSTSGVEYDLYYGLPNSGTLSTSDVKKSSRTLVVYNPDTDGYFVRFDPAWKKADVEVFDMSGKMVFSKKGVDATRDFNLDLAQGVKIAYLVNITSEKGEKVTSKIVK